MPHTLVSGSRRPVFVIRALLAVPLILAAADAAPAPKPDVIIAVFASHYVLGSRLIDDLDRLESAVKATKSRTVILQACGSKADHAQRAAAHRFRFLELELRLLEPHSPACRISNPSSSFPATARHGSPPFGIDGDAVDRWWHASMP
jgi:hypothetical protein